jgi:hypothetical protein
MSVFKNNLSAKKNSFVILARNDNMTLMEHEIVDLSGFFPINIQRTQNEFFFIAFSLTWA